MTAIEQAIREAVEKLWRPTLLSLPHLHNVHCNSEHFLDPAFWQALGKARGWYYENMGTCHDYEYGRENNCAQCKMHAFIDHLADGKDVESFFVDLLTNK